MLFAVSLLIFCIFAYLRQRPSCGRMSNANSLKSEGRAVLNQGGQLRVRNRPKEARSIQKSFRRYLPTFGHKKFSRIRDFDDDDIELEEVNPLVRSVIEKRTRTRPIEIAEDNKYLWNVKV